MPRKTGFHIWVLKSSERGWFVREGEGERKREREREREKGGCINTAVEGGVEGAVSGKGGRQAGRVGVSRALCWRHVSGVFAASCPLPLSPSTTTGRGESVSVGS